MLATACVLLLAGSAITAVGAQIARGPRYTLGENILAGGLTIGLAGLALLIFAKVPA